MDTISGDAYIHTLASHIRTHSASLSASPFPSRRRRPAASGSWFGWGGKEAEGQPLVISPHHLFYVLLRMEGVGLDVGSMDIPLPTMLSRPMDFLPHELLDRSETMTLSSFVSKLSLAPWWAEERDVQKDLRYIYTAFTLIPALQLIPPSGKKVEDFSNTTFQIPLNVFKSLQSLSLSSLDPHILQTSSIPNQSAILRVQISESGVGEEILLPFPELRILSLSSNELHTFQPPPIRHLQHLNLSSNVLLAIPDLSTFSSLLTLDLSSNLLSTPAPSLIPTLLPALTSLNVRHNRIESLVWVEKLLSLEKLDIRHNWITDKEEVKRLSRLPLLQQLWLQGNPFTEDDDHWRTTVFGYLSPETLLDGRPPGYWERPQDSKPLSPQTTPTPSPALQPIHVVNRKRVKRVVDLQTAPKQPMPPQALAASRHRRHHTEAHAISPPSPPPPVTQSDDIDSVPPLPILPTRRSQTLISKSKARRARVSASVYEPSSEPPAEDYKKRIEALKRDMGDGWLKVYNQT